MKIILGCLLLAVGALGNPLKLSLGLKDERIVGGSTAPDGAYPYQISLRTPSNSHFCGGSIISQNYILTAAHCVYGQSPNSMIVVVGTNYLSSGGTSYGVSRVTWHQGYNPNNNVNDIALLLVAGSIQYNARVQPIGLSNGNPGAGAQCVLSGWGYTYYPSNTPPNALQQIGLYAISLNQCANSLPGMPVYNGHVCTYVGYGQGACKGDSGGPLVSGGAQVGVVSWGIPCASGNPDVFTSVAYFRNWIYSNSGV